MDRRWRCSLVLLVLALDTASKGQLIRRPLNPFTVKSPSGRIALWVNPSEEYGDGPAFYRATKDGKLLWQANLPYTVNTIAITDSGLAAGCASIFGPKNIPYIAVIEISGDGIAYVLDRISQDGPQPVDSPRQPQVGGILLDPDHDRLTVRMSDFSQSGESWRRYSFSKLARTSIEKLAAPSENTARSVIGASLIQGTDLVLVDWYTFDDNRDQMGQAFTVVDANMKQVWRIDLVGDFDSDKKGEEAYEQSSKVMNSGLILDVSKPNRFDVRFVKQKVRVKFEARRTGQTWTVTEVGRSPFVETPKLTPPSRIFKNVNLKTVRTLKVPRTADPPSQVHDVASFSVVGKKIILLRGGAQPSICATDLNGREIRTIRLPKMPIGAELMMAKANENRFVLIATKDEGAGKAWAWTVDFARSSCGALKNFQAFHVKSVTAFSDSSFAVLSTEHVPFSIAEHLSLHSSSGSLVWDHRQYGTSGRSGELLSPEDVCADSVGNMVVVDNIRHTLQTFDRKDNLVRDLDLDKAWGKKAEYPTNVVCAPNGGFWLVDMFAVLHIAHDGKIIRRLEPRFVGNKMIDLKGGISLDESGVPWCTDGFSIYRLNSTGLVDLTVGNKTRRSGIGDISQLAVGIDGRVYAQDRVTGGVSVFSKSGSNLFTCMPAATGLQSGKFGPSFDIARSGCVYIHGEDAVASYFPDGTRMKSVRVLKGKPKGAPFASNPNWYWRWASLLDEHGQVQGHIERWPDLSWLEYQGVLEAPNGELAIIETPSGFAGQGLLKLAFLTSHGVPLSQMILPAIGDKVGAAFDGQRVYISTDKGLCALDRKGKPIWRSKPKGWNDKWEVYPSLGMLALYNGDRTVTWVKPQ